MIQILNNHNQNSVLPRFIDLKLSSINTLLLYDFIKSTKTRHYGRQGSSKYMTL